METTVSRAMSGRMKRQVICVQMLNRTKNTKLRTGILRSDNCSVRVCTQHTKMFRTTNTTGEGTPEEIQRQAASDCPYPEDIGTYSKTVDSYKWF